MSSPNKPTRRPGPLQRTLRARHHRRQVPAGGSVFLELTCAVDELSHRIDPDTRPDGRFRALCGRTVLATSLLTAPGPRCPACARAVPDTVGP